MAVSAIAPPLSRKPSSRSHEPANTKETRRENSCGRFVNVPPVSMTHIPQFTERKNRIVNTQDQADEESVDEVFAVPGLAFGSRNQRGYARDQCPQNTGKSSASW